MIRDTIQNTLCPTKLTQHLFHFAKIGKIPDRISSKIVVSRCLKKHFTAWNLYFSDRYFKKNDLMEILWSYTNINEDILDLKIFYEICEVPWSGLKIIHKCDLYHSKERIFNLLFYEAPYDFFHRIIPTLK